MKTHFGNFLLLVAVIAGVIWIGKIFLDDLAAPLVYKSDLTKECVFVDVRGERVSCNTYTEQELGQFRFGGWM